MSAFRVIDRSVFVPSPAPGVGVLATSHGVGGTDPDQLMSVHQLTSKDDTADVAYLRWSDDGGCRWSEPETFACEFADPRGTGRRHPRGAWHDSAEGKTLFFWTEGVLPSDAPLEGMRQWKVHYFVSSDGGRTRSHEAQVIHQGPGFDADHPLPGVTVGRNCVMIGDFGQQPLKRSDGAVVVPVQSSPVGPDGDYHNPGGGHTFTDALMLIGRWRSDGAGLAWTTSRLITLDPARSTRGVIEPTLAELADGRLLVVMRGSNDRNSDLPGHKWAAWSGDGGETWSDPQPWTYDDGEAFFSPSACCQLIPLSDGRILWLGNICESNPKGNGPRYPLVLGEVSPSSGLLLRESVSVLDDRAAEEPTRLTLSNFFARPGRDGRELYVHVTRLFATEARARETSFEADAMLLTVAI